MAAAVDKNWLIEINSICISKQNVRELLMTSVK